MAEDYSSGTRSIGSCQKCRANSELRFFKGKHMCDTCIKSFTNKPEVVKEKVQDNLEDFFPTHKGSYVCINGRRYDLSHAPKTKCKHKVLDWLNSGPVQYPFCPQCSTQVHYERATISEESNPVPEDKGTVDSVPEDPRPSDADEGVAGLPGSDLTEKILDAFRGETSGDPVGNRTQTSEREGSPNKAPDTLASSPKKSRKQNTSSKKSK